MHSETDVSLHTMKEKLTLLLCLFVLSGLAAFPRSSAEIDRYKAVFDRYPEHVPSTRAVDAPLTGNGDIGLVMAPSAEGLTFYFGKNDFWKAVCDYTRGRIAQPGGLTVTGPVLKGCYSAEQLPGSAMLKATFKGAEAELHVCAWVARTDGKVVIELDATSDVTLGLRLWAAEGDESQTAGGAQQGCAWVERSFRDIPYLQWPCQIDIAMNHEQGELHLKAGERHTIVCTLSTSHETLSPRETAISEASHVTPEHIEKMRAEHKAWWEWFWGLSDVSLGDEMLERFYYQSHYIFACASSADKFAPGLWGPFITSDAPEWSGDYHLNYNFQSPYWAQFSSNHICLTENYEEPMLAYMDQGRRHAWNLCRCRGILYPVGLGPKGLVTQAWHRNEQGQLEDLEDGCMFWKQRTNASFVAANMMMHFHSTFDKAYARKVYPFLLACADFWEDFLKLEDGRYVVRGDVFNETNPRDEGEGDFNCLMSLGMARMAIQGAKELSIFLGTDKKRRDKWDDILRHLSAFPTGRDEQGQLSLDYCERDGQKPSGISRLHMHATLIPTDLVGPHLTPEYNDIMLRDLGKWQQTERKDWGNSTSNGIETVYPGAARIGYPPELLLQHLKFRISKWSYPNCYIHAYGGGLETLSAVPGTINEMMMQSYEGILRVFPNWPRSSNASFRSLRAYGAFLVTASIVGGEIQPVGIYSEKGRPCIMENPWPETQVSLIANGKTKSLLSGKTLRFKTRRGETLQLKPL